MPTLPLDYGCFASHSTASKPSSCSTGMYSSVLTPSEPPVPRTSSRTPMKPRSAK